MIDIIITILLLPFELLNYCFMTMVMGFGEPYPQGIVFLRYKWKRLWGQNPEKQEMDVVKGYLYFKLTYKDGTVLLWRGP